MGAKVTVSLPEEMLARIDERARLTGESRSGLVQEAVSRYFARLDEEADREEFRRSVDQGMRIMEELRRMPVLDDRPTLEILREIRDTDGGASAPKEIGGTTSSEEPEERKG